MDILTPPAGRGPGVLVVHPWWGLNQTIRDYGAALAAAGFVVGLADLFDGETTTSIEGAEQLMGKHRQSAAARLGEAFDALSAREAVSGSTLGAVGFSFGGFQLLQRLGEESRRGPLVAYYAVYPAEFEGARVLAHFAESDEFETDEDRDAMIAAMTPNAGYVYPGTKHWFAEADRPEFDADAAGLAFERSVGFLRG